MINIVLHFSLSLMMSITLVPFLMKYAKGLKLIDVPNSTRKQHTEVIPKTGGLAIAIAVLFPFTYLSSELTPLLPLIFGGILIAAAGYIDDLYDIGSWKFLGQFLAVAIFVFGTPELTNKEFFFFETLSTWEIQFIIFIFLIGATNAINLSDGLDGLAAGLALLSIILIALFSNEAGIDHITWICMALIGALMGFLRFNTHPAKVFMGDTGSQFIGFFSAALAISSTQNIDSAISPVLPIFIIGLPITDTLMVISLRVWKGQSPFTADQNHIHHQLLRFGFHAYETVVIMYCLQLIFILSAFFLRYESDLLLFLLFTALTLTIMTCLFIATLRNYQYRKSHSDNTIVERRNLIFRKLNWIYIFSTDIISVSIFTCWIIFLFISWESDQNLHIPAISVLIIFILLNKILQQHRELILRLISYSAAGLTLYSFSTIETSYAQEAAINILLIAISVFLILAMKMTRKEDFQINNQDILILIILILCPFISLELNSHINLEVIILRTAVMIYAIEYIISKHSGNEFSLKMFSIITLITLFISQS